MYSFSAWSRELFSVIFKMLVDMTHCIIFKCKCSFWEYWAQSLCSLLNCYILDFFLTICKCSCRMDSFPPFVYTDITLPLRQGQHMNITWPSHLSGYVSYWTNNSGEYPIFPQMSQTITVSSLLQTKPGFKIHTDHFLLLSVSFQLFRQSLSLTAQ